MKVITGSQIISLTKPKTKVPRGRPTYSVYYLQGEILLKVGTPGGS